MRMITLTKKKIKRLTLAGALTAAAVAVGIGAVLTSVGTQATERLLPIYCVERGDKKLEHAGAHRHSGRIRRPRDFLCHRGLVRQIPRGR